MGYCSGYPYPGYLNPIGRGWGFGFGRGWGFGGGWGRGWRHRHWFYATGLPGWARAGWWGGWVPPWAAPLDPKEEKKLLQQEAEAFERMAAELRKQAEQIKEEEK